MTTVVERRRALAAAEEVAEGLFERIQSLGLVRAGCTEKQISDEICELASREFGVAKYWHKRVVRAGENTLCIYAENPPLRMVEADDIVFVDLGPILPPWEADYGRTFVLGSNADKTRLGAALEPLWLAVASYARSRPECTGGQLFSFLDEQARQGGWSLGGPHAGHLIGQFPEEPDRWDLPENYVAIDNLKELRAPDLRGEAREWVLEVHLVDSARRFGGFFEQWMPL